MVADGHDFRQALAVDDEIDLRAYAEVLWRARYLIAAVTLGAALAAFAVSRFVVPPVYESSVLLVVAEAPSAGGEPASRAPVETLALGPAGYREIVASDAFQELLRSRLAASGPGSGPSLPVRVRARIVPQTNLLELTAEAPTPQEAAKWADEAARLLVDEDRRVNQARMEQSLAHLQQDVQAARQKLQEAQRRFAEFTAQATPLERLQSARWEKLSRISSHEARLADLEVQIAAESARLEALREQLRQQPMVVALQAAPVGADAAGPAATPSPATGRAGGGDVLAREAVNPVYVELQQQVALQEATLAGLRAEREQLTRSLAGLAQEVQQLNAELVRAQATYEEMNREVEAARRAYESAVAEYEAQQAELARRLGQVPLSPLRPATVPRSPARPRPLLNAAVAGMLGAMASVFVVFLAEFWKQPAGEMGRAVAGQAVGGTAAERGAARG